MSIESAKATSEGLAVQTQDPPPTQEKAMPSRTRVNELVNSVRKKLEEQEAEAKKYSDIQSGKNASSLLTALEQAVDKASSEKSLEYSQAGGIGAMLGGLLNAASNVVTLGHFNLGTEIFGGTPSEADKVEMLSRTLYSVGPLYRSELDYAVNMGKQDISQKNRLIAQGTHPKYGAYLSTDDAREVDAISAIKMDIRTDLGSTYPDDFGSEAASGVKDMFESWDSGHAARLGIEFAESQEELSIASTEESKANKVFREKVAKYMGNGGRPEQLLEKLAGWQGNVTKKFDKPLTYDMNDDKEQYAHKTRTKALAREHSDKLGEFVLTALSVMEETSADEAFKTSVSPASYANYHKYGNTIKGRQRISGAVAAGGTGAISLGTSRKKFDYDNIASLVAMVKSDVDPSKVIKELNKWDFSVEDYAKLKAILLEEANKISREKHIKYSQALGVARK
jgi:hypothetical protein